MRNFIIFLGICLVMILVLESVYNYYGEDEDAEIT